MGPRTRFSKGLSRKIPIFRIGSLPVVGDFCPVTWTWVNLFWTYKNGEFCGLRLQVCGFNSGCYCVVICGSNWLPLVRLMILRYMC